jgi:subtilisin-like proprotein convertase family protein
VAGQRETQGQHTGTHRHGRGEHADASLRPASAQPADATDEPLFASQWHLSSSLGFDINVESVWADYTGTGVSVVVVDQGIQLNHPDLDANIDPINQINSTNGNTGPGQGAPQTGDDNHGTAVAGVIAAEDNGSGAVGVAYEATLVPAYTPLTVAADEYAGLAYSGGFDISNNSWGWSPEFSNAFVDNFLLSGAPSGGDANFAQYGAIIEQTAEDGRDGLGTVHVFAAGNLGELGDDVNLHNFQNSRHTIAVGATEEDGDAAVFSTPGAALLLSAPGVEIATTDRTGSAGYQTSSTAPLNSADYASVDGTSFAAPIVSGVTALMLEANSDLGVRDIQEIFAVSSRTIDPHESQWLTNGADWWNGGGLTWSHNYGSGLVDAHAAVRLAETWFAEDVFGTGPGTAATFNNEHSVTQSKSVNSSIPDNSAAGRSSTITIGEDFEIDQVEVHLRVSHTWVGDLTVSLTSPDGTTSMLVDRPLKSSFAPFGADSDHINFVFSSTFHWGEMSAGNWTLNVADRDASFTGTFQNWSLSLYGDNDSNDDTYLYTNEFCANFRHDNAARRTLSDGTGEDTINAAAIDRSGGEDSFINLNAGATSTIAGRALLIAAGTQIENAIAGDGDDIIIGNAAGNKLFGGGGDDALLGRDGDDVLLGQAGEDLLNGGAGHDVLRGGEGNDFLLGGAGNDTLSGGADGDIFVLGDGNDTITDFTAGTDKIDITSIPGIEDFGDFIADFASDDGNGNMTLDLGAHSTHLTAVEIADLSHNDFL